MNLGYFVSPCSRSVLVVLDYERWTVEILAAGFEATPRIVRPATTCEYVYYTNNPSHFPHWLYTDFNELIDEEITSGADRAHLEAVTSLVMSVMDRAPVPSGTDAHWFGLAPEMIRS